MTEGLLVVISAPSGSGKTTILKGLLATLPNLVFSVSHTTRAPRPGEVDGLHYHFVSPEYFVSLRDRKPSGFLEWAEVHGNLYGTSLDEVRGRQQEGLDVLLDIDVQGAIQVRQQVEAITVFIVPPSLAELERRLRGRGTEREESLLLRLENARREIAHAREYDYLIINDQVERAVDNLRSIIIAERSRTRRFLSLPNQPFPWSA